jgi:hypothetical protein
MKENKWQWSGSEKEFLELIRWAIIFRMLCTEKKSGWMKIAFNKDKVDNPNSFPQNWGKIPKGI